MNQETIPEVVTSDRSAWDNFRDTIVEPTATFEDVGQRPGWLVPLLVIIAGTIVTSFLLMPLTAEMQSMAIRARANMTPEQREQALRMMETFKWVGVAMAPIMVAVFTALFALFMWAWGAIAGARNASFKIAFASLLYAGAVLILQGLAQGIVVMVKGAEQVALEGGIPTFGLALFVGRGDMPRLLWGLVQNINFFSIWYAVLVAMAAVYALRMSRGAAYAFAVFMWAVNIVLFAFQATPGG